jgi:AAA domain
LRSLGACSDQLYIQNSLEIDACILLAKELEAKGKDYRIISPYATQTSKIQTELKEKEMDWEDKCFNVDSFQVNVHSRILIDVVQHPDQGNEADYIIISLVRTEAMGFLQNNRRANVLLTRCKKGMFVMTSRELMMKDRSRGTLLGKFAYTWDASQVSFGACDTPAISLIVASSRIVAHGQHTRTLRMDVK